MITPQLPPQANPQNPIENIQLNMSKVDESALQHSGESSVIAKLILRYLTQRTINENEAKQILTGVTLYDMRSGQGILQHNENTEHFAASVNKLPVTMLTLEELRAGRISLNTVLTWQESDRRAGAGTLDVAGGPLSATVGEVITDLLTRSGNTAVRILVNGVLHGAAATNNRLAMVPELEHTRLIVLDSNRFYLGNTTSKEAMFVMRQLMSNQDAFGSYVKQALVNNIYSDIGVKSQLAGNDFIVLVNKIGQLNDPDGDNRHDVGVVYNTRTHKSYGFSYLTTSPSGAGVTQAAEQSLRDMGRYMLRFSGDWPAHTQSAPHMLRQAPAQPEQGKLLY
ncbi:MAG TPA: serine hydrolase [Candidatus Saccharimonadales bacterium]